MDTAQPAPILARKMAQSRLGRIGAWAFAVALALGVGYTGSHLLADLSSAYLSSSVPFVLLGVALLIALAFEFVNGFHDTANAVATVIYTHSLNPHLAVAWSGAWNFIGVLTSTGAVAFGIVSLLPVDLILQVGSSFGLAMVFALVIPAILWNLGTWALGLPASSSHTLIGSILGVGIANQLMEPKSGTSGVDWHQALVVGRTLLISPVVGFGCAALLLLAAKRFLRHKELYEAPKGDQPPPFWIRCLLVLTCTGVSFAHGSNDGQKGMGLIMLILIGTVPTAYALNHAVTPRQTQDFVAASHATAEVLSRHAAGSAAAGDPREVVTSYIRTRKLEAATLPALRQLVERLATELATYKALANVPPESTRNCRNDMYLVSEALRWLQQSGQPKLAPDEQATLAGYKKHIDGATKFIPTWVKVAVAMALGLGTMVGWKRIVVTVGEKIGNQHLTYGQGAAAEIVAMATIELADRFGLPISTTHVLSSGVAGTMVANGYGLRLETVRNLVLAWVLTLPVTMVLSAVSFWLFLQF